jgi:hypothetical protein
MKGTKVEMGCQDMAKQHCYKRAAKGKQALVLLQLLILLLLC